MPPHAQLLLPRPPLRRAARLLRLLLQMLRQLLLLLRHLLPLLLARLLLLLLVRLAPLLLRLVLPSWRLLPARLLPGWGGRRLERPLLPRLL